MSSPALQMPVAGARGSPRPPSSGPGSPSSRAVAPRPRGCRSSTLVSLVLLGGVVGLLLFNTSMQQASFAATALEQQADAPRRARADACAWSSTGCATRSGSPRAAQRLGMVRAGSPAFLAARHRQGHRRHRAPTPEPLRIRAAARPSRPSLDPRAEIVHVEPATRRPRTNSAGDTAQRQRRADGRRSTVRRRTD